MGFFYSQFFVTPAIPTTPLNGQTHIITGSNTGLGLTAATHIARLQPSRLILAVRNLKSGAEARETILSATNIDPSAVLVWQLDMSSFSSVLSFADRCTQELDRIDGVALNAGIQTATFELMEGYESTILVNALSTFLLFLAILPALKSSASKHSTQPRITIISSDTHAWATFPEKSTPPDESILKVMSDPAKNPSVSRMDRYATSKMFQILILRHIHPMLKKIGYEDVIMNVVNPGLAKSTLGRDEGLGIRLFKSIVMPLIGRTQEMGGRPIAAALVAGKESDGQYMHDGVVADEALGDYLKSQEGRDMGARLWAEFKEIFERVRPGVTLNL